MKVLIAPDSFKGNLKAEEVCAAVEAGIRRAAPGTAVYRIPLADGGEGTARAVTAAAGGRFIRRQVRGPLGDPVEAEFGLINHDRTAVLDLAGASGIELVSPDRLDPLRASSYGTGELIAAALDEGVREIIIGIGGSAVNDGGMGMLSALGFKILDHRGLPAGEGGAALAGAASIDTSGADPRLREVSVKVACDVTNPLLGPRGASAVFGPQKGAGPEMVRILEAGLAKLAGVWIRAGLAEDTEHPGDGAAGGTGAALRICLGAVMESGAKLVMHYGGFFRRLRDADLVITGEGQTDGQTLEGKLCSVVAKECRNAGIPVALLSGALGGDLSELFRRFDYAVSVSQGQIGLDAMIRDSRRDLGFAAENLIRSLQIGKNLGLKHREAKE